MLFNNLLELSYHVIYLYSEPIIFIVLFLIRYYILSYFYKFIQYGINIYYYYNQNINQLNTKK